ncbi:MAG: hypothetical protein JNL11_11865 [Bdellovibrionaceae bacterium]|nr:hypothetical protein [Pseudobdellovibrionaceae bacterium]
MKKIFSLVFIIMVAACGTTSHLKILRSSGAFREEPSMEIGYDFKLFVKNTTDFGWNGDNREDREKVANFNFENRCKKIEIIEENPLQTGTYALNRPAITWIMKIKCKKD